MDALYFILDTLLKLVIVAFLLRLVLPLVRADMRTPIGQAVLQFTNPIVMPLRRVLGSAGRVDVASLAALLIVQLAGTATLRLVAGAGFAPGGVLIQGLRDLLQTVLQLYFIAVLVYALLSWIAPGHHSPPTQMLARLCEPLLRPFRRLIPPIAGLDFSALFVLIGLQALLILLR